MPVEKIYYLLPYQFSLKHVLYRKLTTVLNALYYTSQTLLLKTCIRLNDCYREGEVLHFRVEEGRLFHQLYIVPPSILF